MLCLLTRLGKDFFPLLAGRLAGSPLSHMQRPMRLGDFFLVLGSQSGALLLQIGGIMLRASGFAFALLEKLK